MLHNRDRARSRRSRRARTRPGGLRAQRGRQSADPSACQTGTRPDRHTKRPTRDAGPHGGKTRQAGQPMRTAPGRRGKLKRHLSQPTRTGLKAPKKVGPGMGSSGARYKAGRHVFGAAGLSHYSCGPRGRHSQVTARGTDLPAPVRAAHIPCCRLLGQSLCDLGGAPLASSLKHVPPPPQHDHTYTKEACEGQMPCASAVAWAALHGGRRHASGPANTKARAA